METHKFKKGDIITLEGSIGKCAYFIESGKVEITSIVNGKRVVHSLLDENLVFNEMQLIVDEVVPHTATAVEDTELKEITRETFSVFFLKGDCTILSVLSALLERLRTANKKYPIVNYIQGKVSTDNQEETSANIQDNISTILPVDDIGDLVKDMSNQEEALSGEKIIDKRYLVLYGLNNISKDALKWKKIEIRKFPFKVGRITRDELKDKLRPKIGMQDFVLSENDLRIYEEGPHYYISANHFVIDKTGGVFTLTDRGSRLGLIVNDMTIKGSYVLEQENVIIIGSPYSPFSFKLEIKDDIVVEEEGKKPKKTEKYQTIDMDTGFDISGMK